IEDEPAQRQALEKTFQKEKYTVHTASNGQEGFEKAKNEKPDIILLDVIMPIMDGMATLKKINADEDTKHIPVIILTNFALPENIHPLMDHAKDYFLTKTNTPLKDIVAKVATIFS
ncbi:MAG: response regulator, partial [Candidatus Azambacteria bacterium]|nr:response regulator [Candidatus Azambacteria bacterium]